MTTDNNKPKEIYINPHAKGSYKSWWQPTDDGVIAPDGCEVKYIHHKEHEALRADYDVVCKAYGEAMPALGRAVNEIAALQQQLVSAGHVVEHMQQQLDALRGENNDN